MFYLITIYPNLNINFVKLFEEKYKLSSFKHIKNEVTYLKFFPK